MGSLAAFRDRSCDTDGVEDGPVELCPNCGAPVDADGWVVTVGAKAGAVLTADHTCPRCGAGFWFDHDDEDEPQDSK
jgi:ribosomal protein S27AE